MVAGCISQSHLSIIIIDEHVAAAARCTAIAADGGYTRYPRKHEAKRYQRSVDTAAPSRTEKVRLADGRGGKERTEARWKKRRGGAGGGERSLWERERCYLFAVTYRRWLVTYISRATSKLSADREEFRGSGVAWSGAAPFGWMSSCR